MQDSLPQDDAAGIEPGVTGPNDALAKDAEIRQIEPQEHGLEEGAGAPLQDPSATEPDAGPDTDGAAGDAAVLAAMAAADPEATRALRATWGEDLSANLDLARRAARTFASPELTRALEDSGLGDHPALIRVAAEVGRLLEGEATAQSEEPLGASAMKALDAEIDRLHALQFSRPQEYRSERTQQVLSRLYAKRYGQGRSLVPGER
ncbi:MAG: hypothetical protein QNJ06_22140 [Kiloniellales bacterium]|nr:hypothetical protein [Kiloniellales bacterium]